MTREEAIKMAKADLECMERDISGQDEMCNSHKCDECSLNYEKGNMGEQKEWLQMAIQALEQTQWIPVSKKLPEKDKYTEFYECLVAVLYTSKHNVCKTVSAYFDGKHFYRNRFDRAFISGVKAWMPLPASYKGE